MLFSVIGVLLRVFLKWMGERVMGHILDKKKIVEVSEHATHHHIHLHLFNKYFAPNNKEQKFNLPSAVILVK